MFLNIKRQYNNKTPSAALLHQFSEYFRNQVWTGQRLSEVFYDPRSLEQLSNSNAFLHAKCIVVDEGRALMTSANFTEAAHQRNIEAGVLIVDRVLAKAIRFQFKMLVTQKILQCVPEIPADLGTS